MNGVTISFNGQDYVAIYNEQTGYYEIELQAPQIGGVYEAGITYVDVAGRTYEDSALVQVLAKEKIKIETNKVFMWIFDYKDFSVKDIVEIADYEINIDEETNAKSFVKVLRDTTAKSQDIVAIKKNNEVVYWGIVDNISNEDGKILYEYALKYITNIFDEKVELDYREGIEDIIRNTGIEDFLKTTIDDHFIINEDLLINRTYMETKASTHTPLEISVTNVENGIYNLHTWMTNCTQNYNIIYSIAIENKKLIIDIKKEAIGKKIIDVKAQPISNYQEIFETKVIAKVVVKIPNTSRYVLYLLNDRTTTTDMTDENRAEGLTERIYVEKEEDARQEALNVFKQNSYSHMISFNLYDEYIKVGTPIAIKTQKTAIYDTYISAIKITPKKFIEYTCGNIRIKFIDKLLKERSN